MKQTQQRIIPHIAVIAALGLFSGCNWVDSAGRQSNEKPTIILDDGTPDDGFSLDLNEEGSGIIDPSKSSDNDGAIVSWSWDKSAIAAGALNACDQTNGFDPTLAAQSLKDACTDPDQCEVQVETEEVEKTEAEIATDQASLDALGSTEEVSLLKTIFTLTAPKLQAPIGVTYRIVAKDNDGGTGFAEVTLCMVAINEAPEAVEDHFTVLEGVPKEVLATSPVHLLSNDVDDLHVSNQPLSVNPVAVSGPTNNKNFTLGTDGGFYYFHAGDPSRPAGTEYFDEFEYEITDGTHVSQAKAVLRIVSIDDAPVLTSKIPDVTFYVGIAGNFNFGKYFDDPEGATLVYSESNNALPGSYDRTQLGKGFLKSTPKNSEVDQYSLVLSASDDLSTTSDAIVMTIAKNQSPTFNSIANQSGSLGKAFSLDLANYTSDPEKQTLTYKLVSGPTFLKMNGSVLTGTPTTSASWKVTVSVSDGYNSAVSKSFTLTVTNLAPVASAIPDQTTTAGSNFSFNVSNYFSDPDGQKLTYQLIGEPTYLSINAAGVISGTPPTSTALTVTVRASDGDKTVDGSFKLTVEKSNTAPVLVKSGSTGVVVYTQGDSVSLNSRFSDADAEDNQLGITGTTGGSGLTVEKVNNTGVVSGTVNTVGTFTIRVTATDNSGASIVDAYTITVNAPVNEAPTVVKAGGGGTVASGAVVTYTTTFSDPESDTLTLGKNLGGAGTFLTATDSADGNSVIVKGAITNTTTAAVSYNILITANDGTNAPVGDSYTITVLPAPVVPATGTGTTP